MSWLIAIIAIILVVVFWRIFLPLAVVVLVVGGVVVAFVYFNEETNDAHNQEEVIRNRQEAAERIASARSRLTNAQSNGQTIETRWVTESEPDPASGKPVPRIASARSEDGICMLRVERRVDRARLAGLYCPEFEIDAYRQIQVKFDDREQSDPMRLENFSDFSNVYIPSAQYSGALSYDLLMKRIANAKRMAIQVTFEGDLGTYWFAFGLDGARKALEEIGEIKSEGQFDRPLTLPKSTGNKKRDGLNVSRMPEGADAVTQQGEGDFIPIPRNSYVMGNAWFCNNGYQRKGNQCIELRVSQ